ncbi:hypothetical protein SAMN05216555_10373 [Arthrobacter cupressi]|uniref:Uncharacterized protein n=1 Tax=Arthrobacter cupressi TaxID=1045773 RepID=A0A1G8LIA9_9MICC|nr:hypothetical protein SAMN05216555_10373 [Arthrobacter cupressi]
MRQEHKQIREAVRRAFLESDVAGLGTGGDWFPEDEYDAEADRALSLLAGGVSPEEVAAWTVGTMARDWGVDISPARKQKLGAALAPIAGALSKGSSGAKVRE